MTTWRWLTITPEIYLTLTLDSDDPVTIALVEQSAKANGIALARIDEQAATQDGEAPEADPEKVA